MKLKLNSIVDVVKNSLEIQKFARCDVFLCQFYVLLTVLTLRYYLKNDAWQATGARRGGCIRRLSHGWGNIKANPRGAKISLCEPFVYKKRTSQGL